MAGELKQITFSSPLPIRRAHLIHIPENILMATSLTSLSLSRVFLSIDLNLLHLRKLWLDGVYIKNCGFCQGCPVLEKLRLKQCIGCLNLELEASKLKILEVIGMIVWSFSIIAPELETLKLLDLGADKMTVGRADPMLVIEQCPRLRTVIFKGLKSAVFPGLAYSFSDDWLNSFTDRCPSLEKFTFSGFHNDEDKLKVIRINNDTLKTLELSLENLLVHIEITAPHLHLKSFTVKAVRVPVLSLDYPIQVKVVQITLYRGQYPKLVEGEYGEYAKLIKFLGCFNHSDTLTLRLCAYYKDIIPGKSVRDRLISEFKSPLYGVRDLDFHIYHCAVRLVEVVEYMLWLSPRAENLSIYKIDEPMGQMKGRVIPLTCALLLKLVYDEKNDDDDDQPYPWRHCLSEVKIQKFDWEFLSNEEGVKQLTNFFREHVLNVRIIKEFKPNKDETCVIKSYNFLEEQFLQLH